MGKHILLLVGSAKQPRSTSHALGEYLVKRLRGRGWTSETIHLHRSLWTDERRAALIAAVDRADLIALVFPLYIDTLPYLVTKTVEFVAEHRERNNRGKEQRLICVVNCGFPEARQCDTAIAICRQFALEAGLVWAGGLALGGGQGIDGQPVEELGGMTRHIVQALDLTADALAAGRPIPADAIKGMGKMAIPRWLYLVAGGIGWRQQAKEFGVEKRLKDKPYAA